MITKLIEACFDIRLIRVAFSIQYNHNEYYDTIAHTVNHDPSFLINLPDYADELELWQILALESYHIDISKLYPQDTLDIEFLNWLRYESDKDYIEHCSKHSLIAGNKVKSKKLNDYAQYKVFGYRSYSVPLERYKRTSLDDMYNFFGLILR